MSITAPPPTTTDGPSRRQVLGLLGAGGVVAAASGYGALRSIGSDAAGGVATPAALAARGPAPDRAPLPAGAVEGRMLVVIELNGGNDGLATVVPESGRLRDLRRGLLPDDVALTDFVPGTQLHPGLSPVRERGIAVLQGVGTADPDGSHFEMERRWWAGDGTGAGRRTTGFLGRLCDVLAPAASVAGVSLGAGATPALIADHATTIGLPDPGAAWFLTDDDDPWYANLRHGLRSLGSPTNGELPRVQRARRGLGDALSFADVVRSIDDETDRGFPETNLGRQLRLAGGLLDSDIGLRVVHVPFGGFDTHGDQLGEHGRLMDELGGAVAALLDDLATRDLGDRVLIATTSEFGRRPEQNGSGTDHGTAGPALLCGPVVPGLHGDAPSLDRLDDDGNLLATTMLEDYYATLAESWFGVPARDVLPTAATPAPEIIAV
ncbi:MAG: DUF1501 domain-containing protein [Acidimicrobiales bacterium]